MEPISQWLEELGLGQYSQVFVEAEVDLAVLPDLGEGDLEKLGVKLGHRKKLLRAIAALSEDAGKQSPSTSAAGPTARDAERRQVTVMFGDLVGSTALASRLNRRICAR